MRGKWIFAALLSAALLGAGVFSHAAEDADAKAKALLEAKCVGCHELSRPMNSNKNRDGWVQTINKMKKYGCKLTDEESKTLVDYLAKVRGPAAK
jgi:hypothetical protein